MPGIIDQLPSPNKLSSLVKLDSSVLPLDKLTGIGSNVSGMTASVSGIKGGTTLGGISLDKLPASLSSGGIMGSLSLPLDKLKSLNSQSVTGDLSAGHLPVNLPKPEDAGLGNLNSTVSKITSAIIPVPSVSAPPPINADILAVDVARMGDDLRQLGQASANAPIRLLNGIIKVADGFIGQVTDTNNLRNIVVQSLGDIYSQQILNLQALLPLFAVEDSIRSFGTADSTTNFLATYKLLLDEIEMLDPKDVDRLKSILSDGRQKVVPTLESFAQASRTFGFLKANDTAALSTALNDVLDLTGSGEVFLQKYFDAIGNKATDILKNITAPVQALGDMAGSISDYLNKAGDAAEKTAQTVSEQIKSNLAQAEQFLKDVQKTIQDIQAQIAAFIDGVKGKIAPIVAKVKDACAQVGAAVEQFFVQVEQLKQQLDKAVTDLAVQADQKLTDFFNQLAVEIRKLLDQITGVLDRPEVKDALDQARQGIEKFKTTVEQASLKPVFDLVINKTGDVETKVKALDVAKMGTPQKVALKVGVKIIEQVKVDEIIKPELQAAFEQIRAPLADLIKLLKDKALEVTQTIDSFQPGTIITGYVSPPLNQLLDVLDGFRPSRLLAPLKDANAKLTALVEELNPDILIKEVQKVYQDLADVLKVFDPAPLNRMIGDAVDVAVSQLGRIRDHDIDAVLDAVKQAISLQSLMANTGIQEIARSDFWDKLRYYLGGEVLDVGGNAVDQVGKLLADQLASLDFSHPLTLLQATVTSTDNQIKTDAALMTKRLGELNALFPAAIVDQINKLEARRVALQAKPSNLPEINSLLGDLALAPVLSLSAFTAPANAGDSLTAISAVLSPKADKLRTLTQSDFQNTALVIFRKQISDPVHALIDKLKAALTPFKTAIDKIQGILITLTALPPKIDNAVALVLNTARDAIKQVITQTIADIQTFQTALSDTLKKIYDAMQDIIGQFSPYWLLNSFGESEFTGSTGAAGSTPAGMLAIARRIASGRDTGTVPIAALLQTKLSADQLKLLQTEVAGTSLQAGNHTNIITALNAVLRDANFSSRDNVDGVKALLTARIQALQAKTDRTAAEIETLYRATALLRQVSDAWVDYTTGPDQPNAQLRLNRLIVEATYSDDVGLSIQSIHPLIVQNVAHLYPEETVAQLDAIFLGILDKVRALPDKLIKEPLDDAFNKIDAVLKKTFDISGIFTVLEIKLDGIDKDLGQGLDRLSVAYNELLSTFDQRLSAA